MFMQLVLGDSDTKMVGHGGIVIIEDSIEFEISMSTR